MYVWGLGSQGRRKYGCRAFTVVAAVAIELAAVAAADDTAAAAFYSLFAPPGEAVSCLG